uniref:CSON010847 protein n=1 Tax=Culicoides sonorensis TaxID=179676 RepID=A0A336LKS0_CULSO
MNKRPSKNDSEKEILRMQREFLAEKRKNKELQPAAKFVRLTKEGNDQPEIDTRSAFAKSRNISKSKSEKKTEGIIIGEIVERKFDCYGDDDSFNKIEETSSDPFPKPVKLNLSSMTDEDSASSVQKTSIFGKTFKSKRNENTEMKTSLKVNLGNKSALIEGAEAEDIHRENVKKLESLSEEQIIKEREELLKKLDPSLIEFLKSKRNQTTSKENSVLNKTDDQKSTVEMDVDPASSSSAINTMSAIPVVDQITKNAQNWLHFDVLEPEKLEWTKNVEKNIQELKPGESFEARFDWKGVLLPYSDAIDSVNDNRELYLHGDEAHRPGYTLQELFRLARANVLQQRVSALNSIAGILNIYNQGFYDGVLDLPISKIFFFLRFAMDENTPAIIEASSRALAYLFYNDTDEVLLDTIYEASNGMHQPALEKINSAENNEGDPLEDAFSEMNLNTDQNQKRLFSSTIEDEEFEKEKESINDFHLAETDLMECLLRTNILERIRYILITVKPEQTTVSACVKILIRIARTNREMAMKIVMLDTLIKCLIQNYLPRMENAAKQLSDPLIMKLFRILASYDIGICIRLREHGVLDIAKSYIFSRQDINTRLIHMQIETFRFIRLYLTLLPDEKLYTDLLPALRYMLEWHYQNLVFEENGPFIVKQHASAVLNLLLCSEISCCYPIFVDILEISLCKWFNSAVRNGLQEFSQKLLLSTCLNVCGEFMGREPGPFLTFIDNYLRLFLESNTFKMLTEELSLRSSLLTSQKDRSNIYSPLPNLGAIIVRNKQNAPTLIFSKNFPSFLIHSLVTFCHKLSFVSDTNARQQQINSLLFNNDIKTFVNNVIQHLNHKIHTNWFIKTEIMLLLSIINSAKLNRNLIDTRNILGLSLQLLTCLSQEITISLISLLDDVVFNIDYYDCVTKLVTKEQLKEWRSIYVDSIISSLKPSKVCH